MSDIHRHMVELLTELERFGPQYSSSGICGNLAVASPFMSVSQCVGLVCDPALEWEHYSGEPTYPIRGLRKHMQDTKDGTLWSGEAGRLRRLYIDYLLEYYNERAEEI